MSRDAAPVALAGMPLTSPAAGEVSTSVVAVALTTAAWTIRDLATLSETEQDWTELNGTEVALSRLSNTERD